MSCNYKFLDQQKPHFITFSVINWIDVFTRIEYKGILLDSIKYCQKNKGLEIYAWCIMSNHVYDHWFAKVGDAGYNARPKKHTSKEIVKVIRENHQESRKDWMIWMFERAGKRNPNNEIHQFGSRITTR